MHAGCWSNSIHSPRFVLLNFDTRWFCSFCSAQNCQTLESLGGRSIYDCAYRSVQDLQFCQWNGTLQHGRVSRIKLQYLRLGRSREKREVDIDLLRERATWRQHAGLLAPSKLLWLLIIMGLSKNQPFFFHIVASVSALLPHRTINGVIHHHLIASLRRAARGSQKTNDHHIISRDFSYKTLLLFLVIAVRMSESISKRPYKKRASSNKTALA